MQKYSILSILILTQPSIADTLKLAPHATDATSSLEEAEVIKILVNRFSIQIWTCSSRAFKPYELILSSFWGKHFKYKYVWKKICVETNVWGERVSSSSWDIGPDESLRECSFYYKIYNFLDHAIIYKPCQKSWDVWLYSFKQFTWKSWSLYVPPVNDTYVIKWHIKK